ncbi:MAG: hypothetical protein COB85_01455 [Bacteroidetes bacterium]|nr:MAG: hypothetical protein COB85_01455 [Bacteroidota bacterium]
MTKEKIGSIIDYLCQRQLESGEFKSQCLLPGAPEKGWYYTGRSPFLTANILCCIQDIDHPKVKEITLKGCSFLLSLMGSGGLWKYWEDNNGIMEYNVPYDIDDTCLVSYLLKKNHCEFPNNQHVILANLDRDHNFNTWLLPRGKNLRYPGKFLLLANEYRKSIRIFRPNSNIPNNEPISNYWDNEAAVSAHALLYLGENKATIPAIDKIIADVLSGKMNLQYYDSPFYAYHHISRAYKHGIKKFEALQEKILLDISNATYSDNTEENNLHKVTNAITLLNFNLAEHATYAELSADIQRDSMHEDGWIAFKYWTSKQRSWWAGSPEMTAALYAEVLSN